MTLGQKLSTEFGREMDSTRKVLERVPLDRLDWRPHEKSMKLGRLAGHVAELVSWGMTTLSETGFNIQRKGDGSFEALAMTEDRSETMRRFEEAVAATKQRLADVSDAEMDVLWTLSFEGKTMAQMPRLAAFRTMSLNHLIHHRGQLSVYLRILDVPVPGCYGPSADEVSTF